MEKEKLKELRKNLDELKEKIRSFEQVTNSLKEKMEKNVFLPEEEMQLTEDLAGKIITLQTSIRDGYREANLGVDLPDTISMARDEVARKYDFVAECELFIDSVKRFLRLVTEDLDAAVALEKEKDAIRARHYEEMKSDDLKDFAGKYVRFMEAFDTEDSKEKFRKSMPLYEEFDQSLIYSLNEIGGSRLTLLPSPYDVNVEESEYDDTNSDRKIEDDKGRSNSLNGVEEDVDSIPRDLVIRHLVDAFPGKKDLVESTLCQLMDEKVDSLETEELKQLLNDVNQAITNNTENIFDIFNYKEINVTEDVSRKESQSFGVKAFKTEISGVKQSVYLECLRALHYFGVCNGELVSIMSDTTEIYAESACAELFRLGYLRKYSAEDYAPIYGVSDRGRKALQTPSIQRMMRLPDEEQSKETEDAEAGDVCAPEDMITNETFLRYILLIDTIRYVKNIRGRFDLDEFDGVVPICNLSEQVCMFLLLEDSCFNADDQMGDTSEDTQTEVILYCLFTNCNKISNSLFNEIVQMISSGNPSVVIISAMTQNEGKVLAYLVKKCLEAIGKSDDIRVQYRTYEDWMQPCIDSEDDDQYTSPHSEEKMTCCPKQTMPILESEKKDTPEIKVEIDDAIQESDVSNNEVATENESEECYTDPEVMIQQDSEIPTYEESEDRELPIPVPSILWSKIDMEIVNNKIMQMLANNRPYCATAYLKALMHNNPECEVLYNEVAYAVNDPMRNCSYNSDEMFSVYFHGGNVSEYLTISAALRCFFYNQFSYDYKLTQLYNSMEAFDLLKEDTDLQLVLYELQRYKSKYQCGPDKYAKYRLKDTERLKERLQRVRNEAEEIYQNNVKNKLKENASHKRFIATKKLVFAESGDLSENLQFVIADDRDMLEMIEDFLKTTYVKEDTEVSRENLDPAKINNVLDEYWNKAGDELRLVKKSSTLMSSLRTNLYNHVYKAAAVLCDYVYFTKLSTGIEDDERMNTYERMAPKIMESIGKSLKKYGPAGEEAAEEGGKAVLRSTLTEILSRMNGIYDEKENRYFYVPFLKNNLVILTDSYYPEMKETIPDSQFDLLQRIEEHAKQPENDLMERLQVIFDGDDDYGSAELIIAYLMDMYPEMKTEIEKFPAISASVEYAVKQAKMKEEAFIGDLELAESYGQIDTTQDNLKENMLQSMQEWMDWANETKNYGFFSRMLDAFSDILVESSKGHEESLRQILDKYLEGHPAEDDSQIEIIVKRINERLDCKNFAAAEDLLNRLIEGDIDSDEVTDTIDYLEQFLNEYEDDYKLVANAGAAVRSLVSSNIRNKDMKGANRLIENWINSGSKAGERKVEQLMAALGFSVERVKDFPAGKYEAYVVNTTKPENGRKIHYKHPIAVFGSMAETDGFRVLCLYGKYDTNALIEVFKEVGSAKHTLVLLDCALTLSSRRELARRTKTDMTGKCFAVLDRVALLYLVHNYSITAVNKMLMAIIMPFASYQPYIAESSKTMPQEIFIGRKRELETIEAAEGVNIVYGGRQLGKSAMLKMAMNDIDQNENGDRAVVIDIKSKRYKEVAKAISEELLDKGILKEGDTTDDWDKLARMIKNRLRAEEDRIPYLLLMLDEADVFIESCGEVNYFPFDRLKDIQSLGTGRFKFVVAGLRNVVRFNKMSTDKNSVLAHFKSLTVKPFKAAEARELLEIPLSYLGFRFPRDNQTDMLVSTIFCQTNYFPGLLQLYCEKLIETMRKDYAGYAERETPPYIVQEEHIKKALTEQDLQAQIRDKFFITLKVDDDDYYYVIALLMAISENRAACTAKTILNLSMDYGIPKIYELGEEKIYALMEEMKELNVLQHNGESAFRFARRNFQLMMGTTQHIEDELMKYMEG